MSSPSRKRSHSTEPPKKQQRMQVEKAADLDVVLAKCRQLRTKLEGKISTKNVSPKDLPDSIPSDIVEVGSLTVTEVLEGIEGIALKIAQQVLSKKGFSMDIPSRAASNQIYVKEWDRIVLGGKRSARSFINVKVRK